MTTVAKAIITEKTVNLEEAVKLTASVLAPVHLNFTRRAAKAAMRSNNTPCFHRWMLVSP